MAAIPYTQTPLTGAIADVNQVDIYAVHLDAGDTLAADVSPTAPGTLKACLRIFGKGAQQQGFQENASAGADTTLSFDVLVGGTFYIGVSSNGNYTYDPRTAGSGSGGLTSGSYTLTLKVGSFLTTENGANYSLDTAQLIDGDAHDGTINGNSALRGAFIEGQTDYYAFAASQPGAFTAYLTPAPGTVFVPRISLLGASGQLLIDSDAKGADAAVALNQNLELGIYYLAVSAASDPGQPASAQGYLLTSKFIPNQSPSQPLTAVTGINLATGDFNHDGNLDLVTADYGDTAVSVLLGNGDGTFQTAETPSVQNGTTGTGPESVAVGDFNGDGNLDIATSNSGDNTVSVLLGNGDGSFQTAVVYPVGTYPLGIMLALLYPMNIESGNRSLL